MKQNILVVSTYPPKGSLHGNKFSAVASYTKNTLLSMNKELSFKVLADKLEGQDEWYREENVEIKRCWRRGSINLLFALLIEIIFSPEKKVIFCFEWGMFGRNLINLALLPLFLFILKISGRELYIVSHGVLLDYSQIAPQLGQKVTGLKTKIFGVGLKFLYFSIILNSKKVVVFEEYLRQELIKSFKNPEKIITIPHGVAEPKEIISREQARKNLGLAEKDYLILCFGFLIWYKGSDWLIEIMGDFFKNHPGSKMRLIMAGGESQIHKDDSVYREYMESSYEIGKNSKGKIVITGFIPEEKIGEYFSACDLVVLPYRVLVSASGPLSFTYSYKKPFIISENLQGYSLSEDFGDALIKLDLKLEDIVFRLNRDKFFEVLSRFIGNKNLSKRSEELSAIVYESRKWSNTGKKYDEIISYE